MSGAALGGFGAGLAKGLTGQIQYARQEKARKSEREFQMMLPIHLQLAQESGDYSGLENLISTFDPDLAKQLKKNSPFGDLHKYLGPQLAPAPQGGVPGMDAQAPSVGQEVAGVESRALGEQPPLPTLPAPAVQVPTPSAPTSTFFGSPVMSPEERLQQASRMSTVQEEASIQGKVNIARKLYAQGVYKSMADALAAVGLQPRLAGGAATTMRFGGVIKGDQAAQGETDVYGRPLDGNTYYRVQIQPDSSLSYTPTVAPGGNLGTDREAIARAQFGGKSFAQLTPEQQQQVLDAEQTRAGTMAESRAKGTEQGQFESPIDIKTAQETNLPVGTTSAQVAGQTVQTTPDRERVQSLRVLQTDLQRTQDLLNVLPSEKELAGIAPGAVLAARKRMNSDSGLKDAEGNPLSYRAAMAQLQAQVDSMVNVLARVRGEQRGTQTERDAERAYNAVVQLQAGLLDPLGGDTRESAQARIKESLAGLDRVLATIPTQATVPPKAGAGAKPAGTAPAKPGAAPAQQPAGTGLKMDAKGNIIDPTTGKVVIPAQ